MARLPLLHESDPQLSDDSRAFLEQAGKARGRMLNLYRALANRPEAGRAFSELVRVVYRSGSTLEQKDAELAYLTATVVNDCYYWIPTHTVLGRSIGLTEEQMARLADDPLPPGLYTPAQAAIVAYAQKSTRLQPIDDDTYGALSRHFSPQQVIDIALTVGLSNMVNRFHATFHTDLDAETVREAEAGDVIAGACPIPRPKPPSA